MRKLRGDLFEHAFRRKADVVRVNTATPSDAALARYRGQHKQPLALGDVPSSCEVVTGEPWRGGCCNCAPDLRGPAYEVSPYEPRPIFSKTSKGPQSCGMPAF